MGSGRGKTRRAQAKLPTDSPLRADKHTVSVLKLLTRSERKTAEKILGVPRCAEDTHGVSRYVVKTQELAQLLGRDNGVRIWNKILAAYKSASEGYEFKCDATVGLSQRSTSRRRRHNEKHSGTQIVELNLDRIDFSGVIVQDVEFVRCSMRDAKFSNSRANRFQRRVVFDCCDLDGADFSTAAFPNNDIFDILQARFHPGEEMMSVTEETALRFHEKIKNFTEEQKQKRIENNVQQIVTSSEAPEKVVF